MENVKEEEKKITKEIKKNEDTAKKLEEKLKTVTSKKEKQQIKKEVNAVKSKIEVAVKKKDTVKQKVNKIVRKTENNKRIIANTPKPLTPVVSKPVIKPSPVVSKKPNTPETSKPVPAPNKPVVKPSPKPSRPVVKPVTVVSSKKEEKIEHKDYVNFGYKTINDNSKAKGTSGVSKEGSRGYTIYKYNRIVTKYSDGSTKVSDWGVVSKSVVAPVQGVKWVGTKEAPKSKGYLNRAEADAAARAINSARKSAGLNEASYTITTVAEHVFYTKWIKYGLVHSNMPGSECVGYWDTGYGITQQWLASQGHKEAILDPEITHFNISCFTEVDDSGYTDGINWFIFYVN